MVELWLWKTRCWPSATRLCHITSLWNPLEKTWRITENWRLIFIILMHEWILNYRYLTSLSWFCFRFCTWVGIPCFCWRSPFILDTLQSSLSRFSKCITISTPFWSCYKHKTIWQCTVVICTRNVVVSLSKRLLS